VSARLSNIGFLTFDWNKRSSLHRTLLIGIAVAGVLLYVGGKVKIYQIGYRIESLKKEKQELERANRSLRIEASSLSSPARIEEIAIKRLGMVRPAKENVVMVRRKEEKGDSPSPIPGIK